MRRYIATVVAGLAIGLALLPARPVHANVLYFTLLPPTAASGANVTLLGGGFVSGAVVYFGGIPSPLVTFIDAGVMSATIPPGSGTVMVTVVNPGGVTSQGVAFTYAGSGTATLAVNSISPSVAAAVGGTPVTILGTGFITPVTVIFGGGAAISANVVSPTLVSAVAPAGTIGAAPVLVASNGQTVTFNGFVYGVASSSSLAITSVSPNTAPIGGGTQVQIAGSGFIPGATVSFGGVPATSPIVYGGTLITVTAPAGPNGTVPIIVTNPNTEAVAYTSFIYGGTTTTATPTTQPSVGAISPNSGTSAGGTPVTIMGFGFSSPATVTFGGIPATSVNVVNSGLITATTPPNAVGTMTVLVGAGGGQLGGLTAGFTYVVAVPLVTGVAPASGLPQGGTAMTITGSGFVPGATVTVGGATATGVTVVSPTQITATTPAGAAGAAIVLVINPGGAISGLANGFSYSTTATVAPTVGAVTVASVFPSTGPLTGGTSISITGSGFASGASVSVGNTSATAGVISSTQIVVVVPPAAQAGAVAVTVANPTGGAASLPNAFTYVAAAATTPPAPPAQIGPLVPVGGSGLFVFRGGSNADLVAVSGCNASTTVFWTTDTRGTWIGYLPSVPIAIVNAAWNALFPNGIPANTAIFARCA